VQVPRLVRWKFKLETSEILKVRVSVLGLWGDSESFLATMTMDGRIVVPKMVIAILKRDKPSIESHVLDVTLEPY
jgi:hypothetical protein